jgi:drug/metabolite transporter (DMT)-like permease
MTLLLVSIVLSSLLFAGFKWFDLNGIKLLPAIMGNYIGCIVTGLIVNQFFTRASHSGNSAHEFSAIGFSMALGILFFFTFYAMAYVSAHISVGVASASSKMSLVIPVSIGMLMTTKSLDFSRILSLALALLAVILMTKPKGKQLQGQNLLLPFLVFLGSGAIDTAFGLLQTFELTDNLFDLKHIIYIFSGAFLTALLFIGLTHQSMLSDFRSMGFGFLLGIPNYFSILVIFIAMSNKALPFHEFFLLNNVGVMIFSFLLGLFLFNEKITPIKGIGLFVAVLSIYLILHK